MVRVKHRYILVEILPVRSVKKLNLPFKESDIVRDVRYAVEKLHGDYGAACIQIGLAVKLFNPATRVFILRVRKGAHVFVSSALPFITSIARFKVVLKTLHLSGTIRSCLKFLKTYDQKKFAELFQELQLPLEKKDSLISHTVAGYIKLDNKEQQLEK